MVETPTFLVVRFKDTSGEVCGGDTRLKIGLTYIMIQEIVDKIQSGVQVLYEKTGINRFGADKT